MKQSFKIGLFTVISITNTFSAVDHDIADLVASKTSLACVQLDATKSQYLVGINQGSGSNETCTVSMWVNPTFLPFQPSPVFFHSHNHREQTTVMSALPIDDRSSARFYATDRLAQVWQQTSSDAVIPAGAWSHIVFSFKADRSSSFSINGREILAGPVNDLVMAGIPFVYLGWAYNAPTWSFFNGRIAEVHGIDGLALRPDAFAEQRNGQWLPKQYVGEHGSRGFHLDFKDPLQPGRDVSGRMNHFSSVNGSIVTEAELDRVQRIDLASASRITLQLATESKQLDKPEKLTTAYAIADHFPDAERAALRAVIDAAYGAAIPRIDNTVPQAQADRLALLRSMAQRAIGN